MITIHSLLRSKQAISRTRLAAETGDYDHHSMKRWQGNYTALVRLTMKSSTAFDGEAKNNEGDRSTF